MIYNDSDRNAHSVVDVTTTLHGATVGSCDVPNDIHELRDWLQWRVGDDGWRTSTAEAPEVLQYEATVRELARNALQVFDTLFDNDPGPISPRM